jgi:flagellar capping protein FliD
MNTESKDPTLKSVVQARNQLQQKLGVMTASILTLKNELDAAKTDLNAARKRYERVYIELLESQAVVSQLKAQRNLLALHLGDIEQKFANRITQLVAKESLPT